MPGRGTRYIWQPQEEPKSNGELAKFIRSLTPEQWEAYERRAEVGLRRKYKTATASRAKKSGSPQVDAINRFELYERDNGICHICGGDVPRHDFHLDHVVPLSRGGHHTAENLKVAHPLCNTRKGARI